MQDIAFETRKPPPRLSPYVHNVSAYVEYSNALHEEVETPTASILPMIIVLGHGWDYSIHGTRYAFGESFVAGLCTTPITMHSTGFASCIQVNFTVEGARRFLGMNMSELRDNLISLEDALGERGRKLQRGLSRLNNWDDRFDFLYQVLVNRLLAKAGDQSMSKVVSGALRLIASHEAITVNQLTDDLGTSRKHLTKRFSEEVGLSPGQFLQLRRFEKALSLVEGRLHEPLVDIALGSGFSDQAHFSREFSRYMGCSPALYRSQQSDQR